MKPIKIFLYLMILIAISSAQEWRGADEIAEEAVSELNPHYEPWFSPIFEPTGELESLFFSIQAAVGGFLIGYFLGRHDRKS